MLVFEGGRLCWQILNTVAGRHLYLMLEPPQLLGAIEAGTHIFVLKRFFMLDGLPSPCLKQLCVVIAISL